MKRYIIALLLLGCFAQQIFAQSGPSRLPSIIGIHPVSGGIYCSPKGFNSFQNERLLDCDGEKFEVVLNTFVQSSDLDDLEQIIGRSLLLNGTWSWLVYEGTSLADGDEVWIGGSVAVARVTKLKFRCLPNTSMHPRVVIFHCPEVIRNGRPTITYTQPGNSGLSNFDLSSTVSQLGVLYPAQRYTITLSGSEPGVEYVLSNFGGDVAKMDGTGQPLKFTGAWGDGSFTVMARKDGNFRSIGDTLKLPMSLLVRDQVGSLSKTPIILPPGGGQQETALFFSHLQNHGQVKAEAEWIVNSWARGESEGWPDDFQILNPRNVGQEFIYFTISAGPNTTDSVRRGVLSVGVDKDGQSRNLYVVQEPITTPQTGLTIFDLHAEKYIAGGTSEAHTDLWLSGSQEGVVYRFYNNGTEIRSFNGTGASLSFINVAGSGPFTAKAFRGSEVVTMKTITSEVTSGRLSGGLFERVYNPNPRYASYSQGITNVTRLDGLGRTISQTTEMYPYYDYMDKEELLGYDWTFLISQYGSASWQERWEQWAPEFTFFTTTEFTEYDAAGRPYRTRTEDLNKDDYSMDYTLYDGFVGTGTGYDRRDYTEVEYDNTPQDKIVRETPEGFLHETYSGGKSDYRMQYTKNTSSDAVKRFVSEGTSVRMAGTYPAGALQKDVVDAPHGQTGAEFHDLEGRLIASRQASNHFTHYVYDDMGRLRCVIPPLMDSMFTSGTRTLEQLGSHCYWYEYDEEGRVYRKNIPGAGVSTTLYNKRGQVVLQQDARMAAKSPVEWIFTKYDSQERVAMTGIYRGGTAQTHKQALASQNVLDETRDIDGSRYPWATVIKGYSNAAYPTDFNEDDLLTVYYYDDYNWEEYGCHIFQTAQAMGEGNTWTAKGSLTGFSERILNPDGSLGSWLGTTLYYDTDGRVRQKIRDMMITGEEVESYLYDETGNIVQTRVRQNFPLTILAYDRYYRYNEAGRLLYIDQEIDENERNGRVRLATYWYDYQGRLSRKWLHGLGEKINYTYGVDGALTEVESYFLSYKLKKDDAAAPYARYDGNLGEIDRKQIYMDPREPYTENDYYTYDNLGRLAETGYGWDDDGVAHRDKRYGYDRNGNMTSIDELQHSDINRGIDFQYGVTGNGNALNTLTKRSEIVSSQFVDVAFSGYTYDRNGNMTHDAARGVDMTYNLLNLPAQIDDVSYWYTATGRKTQMSVSGDLTNYEGEAVYQNYILTSLSHPEGEVGFNLSSGITIGYDAEYNYFLKDHLGSIRTIIVLYDEIIPFFAEDYYKEYAYYDFASIRYDAFGEMSVHGRGRVSSGRGESFTGQEYQNAQVGRDNFGLNMYDFGARFYDPSSARWTTIDPLAEKYYSTSPYAYAANNPVRFVDPDGRAATWYFDDEYNLLLETRDGLDNVVIVPDKHVGLMQYYAANYDDWESQLNDPAWNLGWLNEEQDWGFEFAERQFGAGELWHINTQTTAWSREAAAQYYIKPTLENGMIWGVAEAAAQWVNPERLALGASVGVSGLSSLSGAKGAARATKGYSNAVKGFTKHGLDQSISRGFRTADIMKIVREGTVVEATGRYGVQMRYTLGGNTVVLNANGRVVTVFSNTAGTRNGLGRGNFITWE